MSADRASLGPEELALLLVGAADTGIVEGALRIHRLGSRWEHQFPQEFINVVAQQGSGVHLVFETDARHIVLSAHVLAVAPEGAPEPAPTPFELAVDGVVVARAHARQRGMVRFDPVSGTAAAIEATPAALAFRLPAGGPHRVTLWLPHDEIVRLRGLEADASIRTLERSAPRWVHYGSSISQGASAGRPTGIWPVVAAQSAGMELTNLGLSGNAVLDPFAARTIAELPADVISLKVGINIINNDCFTERSLGPALHGFLDIMRQAQPETPILLTTALACPLVESVPGPTYLGPDGVFRTHGTPTDTDRGRLTLSRTREVIADLWSARGDPNLHLVDGLGLFGTSDLRQMPMADSMHPGAPAHELIGSRFAGILTRTLSKTRLTRVVGP